MNTTYRMLRVLAPITAGVCAMASMPALAFDITNDDWKFSLNGNVNVHYIYSNCESTVKTVDGGLACGGSKSGSSVSNIGNGLLPAAFSFAVATQQEGFDISAHLGLYPGIATNDGGSPNLQQNTGGGAASNTALGTTGLDVRQVYLTFGNKDIGTFMFGRNFGLFGFDAIINDMTLPGVGGPGSAAGISPANTTLGGIGLGYIYVDTLAQMDYTTPDFYGLKATIGVYDPLNSATNPDASQPKAEPGIHGKLAYTYSFDSKTKLYLSSAFINQKQKYIDGAGMPYSYNGFGIDAFAMIDWQDLEAFGYYYHGSGVGTTGLFILSDDSGEGLHDKRGSEGYLFQATYRVMPKLKLGVNYGASLLHYANATDAAADAFINGNHVLVASNRKITGGAYYSLTKNLTLLSEISSVQAKAHDGDKNDSITFNVGAFLSF